jgi:hypothetical protein
MNKAIASSIRFGVITDRKVFSETGRLGDWHWFDTAFSPPFGAPIRGIPKGVPRRSASSQRRSSQVLRQCPSSGT